MIRELIRRYKLYRMRKSQRWLDEWTARQLGMSYEEYIGEK